MVARDLSTTVMLAPESRRKEMGVPAPARYPRPKNGCPSVGRMMCPWTKGRLSVGERCAMIEVPSGQRM